MRYHPHTPEDVRQRLETVGAKSLEDLFRSIPERLRLSRPLEVPAPIDEIELLAEFRRLAARNQVEHPPFLGAGAYPHHVPPTVDQLLLRGEFFTAYTPYQPEISQRARQQHSSCVLKGFDAQRETAAPTAFNVSIRTAVSVVTWRHAESLKPFRGFSL